MGLILRSDETKPLPRRVDLVLSCDAKHGLFEGDPPTQTFTEGYYADNRRAATAAGWLVTGLGKVYCPACAKRPDKGAPPAPKTKADMVRLPV